MMNPSFAIIGLDNGSYHGWNLSNNTFDSIPAHQKGVTALFRYDNYLLSGDREGGIQVRDINNSCNLAVPPLQIIDPKSISCLTIIKPKGEFLILAGDEGGLMSVGKVSD